MKKIRNITFSQFEMLIGDTRLLSLVLLIFFIHQSITSGMCEEADIYGGKLHILEPFIATTGAMWLQMVIPVIYLLIMYDFPVRYGGRIYYLIRAGRYEWYYSQILFSFLTALIYALIIFAISVLLSIGHVSVQDSWSRIITDIGTGQFLESDNYTIYIKPSCFYQGSIYAVFIYDFVFLVLNLLLMNMIQLCLFAYNIRKPALFLCLCIEVAGAVLAFVTDRIRWIFPSANTIFSLHFENYISAPKYPVYFSVVYFIIAIIVVYIVGFIGITRARLADKVEG